MQLPAYTATESVLRRLTKSACVALAVSPVLAPALLQVPVPLGAALTLGAMGAPAGVMPSLTEHLAWNIASPAMVAAVVFFVRR